MKALYPLLLAYGALVSEQALAQIDEPDIQADCQKVPGYAELGTAAYQRGDYVKAAEIFRDQAAWSEFCGKSERATATAYNNVALAWIHAGQLLKARAYLALAPHDSKSQHNLALLQARLAQQPAPDGPAGVYWQYAGRGVWSEVSVAPQGRRWHVSYAGYYMPGMGLYYGPNMGEFSDLLTIVDNRAVYHQSVEEAGMACDVTLQFSADAVDLHTQGDCGFGHNVQAQGRFVRVE
ncbi:tetratricopeptide repeat protein [Serratia sp. AKBS12]|uniref:tetratricopeptide repeat protein n=1 Tax=Serratia sp. AKBS12 TaxID=2974597 RepID=UPI002166B8BD|nr:tetratricopeptide repeat protein [Serratia sp. AKBS12]MCS3407326.1 tetratricopeptide repeat protein [Serratia sp. AKBS12]HEI8868440.1 tetratricopeptide repeat protein [Serratia odorifera]